ncbi:MAG: recG [Acidimicrobiaceae bacterium]|nr:recG [Acidimicrobiaceae bacterium]
MSQRLARLDEIPVTELRGVGRQKASALGALGITSLLDLVMHYPRRWADRTAMATIAELVEGEEVSVHATVRRSSLRHLRGRRTMVEAVLVDGSGPTLSITFFNQAWRASQLAAGAAVVVNGRPTAFRGGLQMTNPRLDVVARPTSAGDSSPSESSPARPVPADEAATVAGRHTGRIVPIYPQSDKAGIASHEIDGYVAAALERADREDAFADPLSARRRFELDLVSRAEAFHEIHEPRSFEARDGARRRLAFDELWRLQVALVMRKRAAMAAARGIRHEGDGELLRRFLDQLPFPLTGAQERAIADVGRDLAGPYPMHRLLQGDVGSGKTVVALAALLRGVEGGYQGAFMVPTEVLAEQHLLASRRHLGGLSTADPSRLGGTREVAIELLTSRTGAAERARITAGLASGSVDILVGTHALLTEDVRFSSLGVVVVDEQHRFGVEQRAALREKGAAGHDPDLLVMTATPIPRTAAMTVYGDLDSTVLDELPPGRTPVRTQWIDDPLAEGPVWQHVRDEVALGHQVYVVCPLVRAGEQPDDAEEGPELDEPEEDRDAGADRSSEQGDRVLRSAVEEHARLVGGELAGCRVGLLHGQLRPSEKEGVMAAFRDARLDVLVATTVIEVGVDVATATVVVIEDADRFGIAQLHQLRGRVGRGTVASTCYLLSPAVEDTLAGQRLRALEATTDGFELAEVDLELRGEGTVLGARQKGRNDLRLASLRRDRDLVDEARALAESVLDTDPGLARHPLFAEELRLFVGEEEAAYLFKS